VGAGGGDDLVGIVHHGLVDDDVVDLALRGDELLEGDHLLDGLNGLADEFREPSLIARSRQGARESVHVHRR
jgi:hypothetical protein